MIGVVRRGIFKLLEEGADGGAHFCGVGRLRVAAVGDVERIHGHRGLLCSALIGQRDILRVVGNSLEHPQRNSLVVWHGGQPFRDALCQRRCS